MDMYNTLEVSKCSATIISSFFHVADIKNTINTPYLLPETARSGFKSVFNEEILSAFSIGFGDWTIIHLVLSTLPFFTRLLFIHSPNKKKNISEDILQSSVVY